MSAEGKFLIAVENIIACSKEHLDKRPCPMCVKALEKTWGKYKEEG